jgi:hypothetical protein|tara:strand:- start:1519 stop:2115 length:597 start_codon:yes stop_codon:yes gene_type:complete
MQNQTHDFKEQETSYQAIVPNIDAGIPIPKNTKAALPDMTPQEELTMRSKTIKLVSDLADEVIEPTTEDIEQAEDLAREIMKNPELKPEFGNYPNETIAYLAGLVAQTSHMVAKDLADIKLSVLNGLLQEASLAKTSRERISAWSKIGEIDGVDAFKRKTEITHITKSGDELEKELLETINSLKSKVIDGEHTVVDDD